LKKSCKAQVKKNMKYNIYKQLELINDSVPFV